MVLTFFLTLKILSAFNGLHLGGDDTMSNISYVADEFQKRLTDVGKEPAHIHYIASRFKRDVKVAFEEVGIFLFLSVDVILLLIVFSFNPSSCEIAY